MAFDHGHIEMCYVEHFRKRVCHPKSHRVKETNKIWHWDMDSVCVEKVAKKRTDTLPAHHSPANFTQQILADG
jgi:hypothetical protein